MMAKTGYTFESEDISQLLFDLADNNLYDFKCNIWSVNAKLLSVMRCNYAPDIQGRSHRGVLVFIPPKISQSKLFMG